MHHRTWKRGISQIITAAVLLAIVGLVATYESANAQTLDLAQKIRTGAWKPYKVAIGDFKVLGQLSLTTDSLAKAMQKIVTDDLDFHIFFDTIPKSQFYLDVWEIKDITPDVWQRMGADYLIEGDVELAGGEVKVLYRIHELTPRVQELTSEKLSTTIANHRRLAHMISDAAVEHIAAEKGFFTTRIAYVSSETGHKELYLCDYDGANPIQITADKTLNLSPAWDRKEEKLLFTTYRTGRMEVWERDIRTGKSQPISAYQGSNNAAEVSPDNKEIVITLSKDGNSELYVVDRKGKIKRRLTQLPSIEVSGTWSPTGREIAFSSDRAGQPQIFVMDSEGFGVTRLTYEGKYNDSPRFSPKGDVMAFVSRGDDGRFRVCTIDVTGQNFQRLDQTGSNENPHWSPDGWHLVYCKYQGKKSDLYIMDRFSQKIKKITNDGQSSNPAWQPYIP